MFVVMIGWVFFICPNFSDMGFYFSNLFGFLKNNSDLSFIGIFSFKVFIATVLGLFFTFAFPFIKKIKFFENKKDALEVVKAVLAISLLVVTVVVITSTSFSPSIYGAF